MWQNCVTSITSVLQNFADFFHNIISIQHVLHFDIGRSQIDWNLKVRSEISACTAIMLKNHSDPSRESTIVLSDKRLLSIR